MRINTTFRMILEQQKAWADKMGIGYEKSSDTDKEAYTYALADNLYLRNLSSRTLDEYNAGRGKELDSKMRALYSSSALVVNVFEYWRQANRISEVARACGAPAGINDMAFERRHKIGNLGTSHLDIEFSGEKVKPFAIEAKFMEPHQVTKRTQRNNTNMDKYLAQAKLWQRLDKCQELAVEILEQEGKKTRYEYLDAPQLIKHILSLSYHYNPNGFTLLYLWFDCDTEEARKHNQEINRFHDYIKGEVDFRTMTYHELYKSIRALPAVDERYLEYIGSRYFVLSPAGK